MYFTAKIRARSVHIRYDEDGELIKRDLPNNRLVEKVIKLDRILSFTEDHLFVQCPHDSVEVWEYEGNLEGVKAKLRATGSLIE